MRKTVLSTNFHRRNEKNIINIKHSAASLAQVSCSPVSSTGDIISSINIVIARQTIII
jgi:hypothetical protein